MKKIFGILMALVLLSALLVACAEPAPAPAPSPTPAPSPAPAPAPSPAPAPAPAPAPGVDKYGGVLKIPLTVGPATPIGYPSEGAPDAQDDARPCLENLITAKGGGVIEAVLATGWEIASDGKSIKITLRKGVRFHDGTDFNAAAVKFNLDNMIAAKKVPEWQSVDIIDDYTVQLNITGLTNGILTTLGTSYTQMISPTAVEKNGLEWARWHPVGTGPFKFVEYDRDVKLVYERNENYWQPGKPYLDGIEYHVIADETVRKIAFEMGDVHTLRGSGMNAQELKNLGYPYTVRAGGTYLLIPDSTNPESPFADRNVRLAVEYAIDREALADALGYGFMRPAYQVYPGFEVTRVPNLEEHNYNPAKARQLLTDAGYPDGFKTKIHAFIRVVPKDYVSAIVNMLREVGIEAESDFPEAGRYTELRFGGWNDGMMAHAMASFDENMFRGFSFYFGSTQFPSVQKPDGWSEAYYDALYSSSVDPLKVQKLVKLMYDETMVIPYLEETAVQFFQMGVHDTGMLEASLFVWYPENTWLDPDLR